jgi:hypothetical protein
LQFRLSTLERLAKPDVLEMIHEDDYVAEKPYEEV